MEVKEEKKIIINNGISKKNLLIHKYTSKQFWFDTAFKIGLYLLLMDLAFVFVYPFIDMIITSIKTDADLLDITVKWLPNKVFFNNYKIAYEALNYGDFFKNSVIVTGLAVVGHVLSCSMVAYGFARYNFPLKNILFAIVIFSMIVPIQVLIFPLYMMFSKIGWLNTYLPLTVPTFLGFGFRGGLFIFLFRQFFMGLPYEIEEAARIDGCGSFRIYTSIILPMSKSSILVSIVLAMVWHWNDYFEPTLYLTKPAMSLLPSRLPYLYSMLTAESTNAMAGDVIFNAAIIMAATFMVILPLLIVYSFLQRKFMEGIERSGLTGQ